MVSRMWDKILSLLNLINSRDSPRWIQHLILLPFVQIDTTADKSQANFQQLGQEKDQELEGGNVFDR